MRNTLLVIHEWRQYNKNTRDKSWNSPHPRDGRICPPSQFAKLRKLAGQKRAKRDGHRPLPAPAQIRWTINDERCNRSLLTILKAPSPARTSGPAACEIGTMERAR